jgi:hypothetical protein
MPCKIASFLRPKTDMWYGRLHSFLENFIDNSGYIGRRAFYQNQWAGMRKVFGWSLIVLCQS